MPAPTESVMLPELPPVEKPVARDIDPDTPELAVPVDKDKDPLWPSTPELGVPIIVSPLDANDAAPDCITTFPADTASSSDAAACVEPATN